MWSGAGRLEKWSTPRSPFATTVVARRLASSRSKGKTIRTSNAPSAGRRTAHAEGSAMRIKMSLGEYQRALTTLRRAMPRTGAAPLRSKSKYRNIKVEVDGAKFDSAAEAACYQELR